MNAAHHLRFLVETLWSPKTMLLIKSPKIWVLMRAITFCLCVLWKACITWHFWATNRKLTFSWKITPQGAIPPLKIAHQSSPRLFHSMTVSQYDHVVPYIDLGGRGYFGVNAALVFSIMDKQGKSEGFESCDRPIVRKRPIWVKLDDF